LISISLVILAILILDCKAIWGEHSIVGIIRPRLTGYHLTVVIFYGEPRKYTNWRVDRDLPSP
jgi:hypothetical protein